MFARCITLRYVFALALILLDMGIVSHDSALVWYRFIYYEVLTKSLYVFLYTFFGYLGSTHYRLHFPRMPHA